MNVNASNLLLYSIALSLSSLKYVFRFLSLFWIKICKNMMKIVLPEKEIEKKKYFQTCSQVYALSLMDYWEVGQDYLQQTVLTKPFWQTKNKIKIDETEIENKSLLLLELVDVKVISSQHCNEICQQFHSHYSCTNICLTMSFAGASGWWPLMIWRSPWITPPYKY